MGQQTSIGKWHTDPWLLFTEQWHLGHQSDFNDSASLHSLFCCTGSSTMSCTSKNWSYEKSLQLAQACFYTGYTGKNLFTKRAVKHYNRLPRAVVVLKGHVDVALGDRVKWWDGWCWVNTWTQGSCKSFPTLTILWFYQRCWNFPEVLGVSG